MPTPPATAAGLEPSEFDLHFYFDPVCPFAWMTSKWVRLVASRRDYRVDWRFISLRILNAHIDYDTHFPPEYEAGHTAGLRLLRVLARVRAEHGRDAVGPLYEAVGSRIFDTARDIEPLDAAAQGTRELIEPLLVGAGLPTGLADALDATDLDEQIRAETDEALALTGRDVGTPILHFQPPTGTAFFGPVISRLPAADDAVALWDHVIALASFPGFAELKRSLRELPQLAGLGVDVDEVGAQEDWHGGSRRLKR
ncbi:MAG: hypothetical protein SW019_10770 [Actinomycetota bacterium]|nr:hypothetical protein [Actinomycetota bacterium]